jgi:glycosyltransferase involved in cell wall biosynthesis
MEVHVDSLARGLAAHGCRVTVVTTGRTDGTEVETTDGVRTFYLSGTTPGRYSHDWGRATLGCLERLHAEHPIDIIWGEGAGAYYYLKWYRNPLAVPVFTFLQGTYLGELGTFWALFRARGEWRKLFKVIPWRTVQYFRWDLWYTHGADAVIGASRENARLARWGYFLPRRKVAASVNGVDVDRFAPDPAEGSRLRRRLGISDEIPVLLHCSRLEPEKGCDVAIRAFAQLRSQHPLLRLIMAGDGSQREALRALAAHLRVSDGIHFSGHVPNHELPAFYNACTVFLYPTLAVESFGIAVAEAMACGRPVVASRRGGIRTSIDDQETGLLVPVGDAAALARATARLLADPSSRERIGKAARVKAERDLSTARMVEDVLTVVLCLMAHRRRGRA